MRSTCPIVDDVDGFMRNNEIKYANNVAAELIVNVLCFFFIVSRCLSHKSQVFLFARPEAFNVIVVKFFNYWCVRVDIMCARARLMWHILGKMRRFFFFCVLRLKGTILFV